MTREVQKTKRPSQQSNAQWTVATPQGERLVEAAGSRGGDQALESEASLHLSYDLGLVDRFDDASEAHTCVLCTLIPTTLYNILFKCAAFFHKVGCVLTL